MDRSAFLKRLSRELYPILRTEGFKGSGTTLRRINDPVAHVFNFQGSSGSGRCYLNLGVHLLFLTPLGAGELVASKLAEPECFIRDRLHPPPGFEFGWSYGQTTEEMEENIACICEYWGLYGQAFFERYTDYPGAFQEVIEEADETSMRPGVLKTSAQIAEHLGDRERAKVFVEEALRRCPERATSLRANLERMLADGYS